MSRNPIVVGYCLNAKKMRRSESDPSVNAVDKAWCGGGLADLLECGGHESVIFEPFSIDSDSSIDFDLIIHKLTEDLMEEERGHCSDKLMAIRAYMRKHPRTILVDPLESVRALISRVRMHAGLRRAAQKTPKPFADPAYFVANSLEVLARQMDMGVLSYPIICKPVDACGTPGSHKMAVVLSSAGLHLAPLPCVVAEYRDHSEQLFKVYVIDNEVMVHTRRSLPDLRGLEGTVDGLGFDSRMSYPTRENFIRGNEYVEHDRGEGRTLAAVPSNINVFRVAASAIKNEFKLSLFGFDVICPVGTDELVIVDVNFFPSYKEVLDFPQRFRCMLLRKAFENCSKSK